MARKEKAWMIWDCTTGSVDGFYYDKKLAKSVLERLKEAGCVSIMLCEIEGKDPNHGIPNHLWHAANGVGFFGREGGK
jgi:predicted GTPase